MDGLVELDLLEEVLQLVNGLSGGIQGRDRGIRTASSVLLDSVLGIAHEGLLLSVELI